MLVMGTQQSVFPFPYVLVNKVASKPAVFINIEDNQGDAGSHEHFTNRLFLKGETCDEVVTQIVKECGWANEFDKMTEKCAKVKNEYKEQDF